jgi:hypothetical protein
MPARHALRLPPTAGPDSPACVQDEPKEIREAEVLMHTFFLPIRNPKVNHTNPTLQEYFRWNNLEIAPVSAAAKQYVHTLEMLGVPPSEWRDRYSRPLLYTATRWNYISLVKWLISKGCSVANEGFGNALVEMAEGMEFVKLAAYLRERLEEATAATEDDTPLPDE